MTLRFQGSARSTAVREIIKTPAYVEHIRTIVLADSMYAGLETNAVRRPPREHIDVWVPFARAAIKGEKTFVFTYSAVPTTTYASSSECAHALLAALNIDRCRSGRELNSRRLRQRLPAPAPCRCRQSACLGLRRDKRPGTHDSCTSRR